MATASAFGVISVDRAAGDCGNSGFEESCFVDRIGVNCHLNIELVGDFETRVDCGGRGAPILVEFETAGACDNLLNQRRERGGIPFTKKTEIHWPRFGGLQHAGEIPGAGRAGGGGCARCRACAAANHRRDPARNRFVNLLGRDEMDVAIDAAGSDDEVFASDSFRGGADDEIGIDAIHRVGISGFADPGDASVLYADVGFHDSPVIENHGVGDDEIERAGFCFADGGAALAHAVANYFSAAESDLIAVVGEVFFYFDQEIGVSQANAVAFGWAV